MFSKEVDIFSWRRIREDFHKDVFDSLPKLLLAGIATTSTGGSTMELHCSWFLLPVIITPLARCRSFLTKTYRIFCPCSICDAITLHKSVDKK
jgi:hypothetical protein